MRQIGVLVFLLLPTACGPGGSPDFDGDGFPDSEDCEPEDPAIHPGADDPYGDDVDQNCDGADGIDSDGDGFPAPGEGTEVSPVDCDDSRADVYPGAPEEPDDGVDSDCDGEDNAVVDTDGDGTPDEEDCAPEDPALSEADADGDGISTCGGDCDDDDPDRLPFNTDAPCDGVESDCVYDPLEGDEDGDGWLACGDDCDDSDPAVHPGALDDPDDGSDADCDGLDGSTLDAAAAVFAAPVPADRTGWALAAAGDVNGDGYDDFLVGAGVAPCAVYLVAGSATPEGGILGPSTARNVFVSANEDERCGYSVAGPGDVDGDGLDDILIGAPVVDQYNATGGGAYLVFGASLPGAGTVDLATADVVIEGEAQYNTGYSVAGAGDVDGDGGPDLLVGARGVFPGIEGAETPDGRVYLFLSGTVAGGGVINCADAWAILGQEEGRPNNGSNAAAGDIDGDGFADVMVGYGLFLGSRVAQGGDFPGGTEDATFAPFRPGSISPAGDVDGDGRPDLLLGTTSMVSPGKASLWSGADLAEGRAMPDSAALAMWFGELEHHQLGWSVAGVGDADGDGLGDLLIGAPGDEGAGLGAGAAYLIRSSSLELGPAGSLLAAADAAWAGPEAHDRAGRAVAGAGDFNGDGRADLLVGGPNDSYWGQDEPGLVWLLLSPP